MQVPTDGAPLYVDDVGTGQPIVVVHGGPDFDSTYLRPELDGLAASFRLVYYDQRGRGRSAGGVSPEDVSISSDVEDLDRLRSRLGYGSVALLGHSWGGLLALEYAVRHPDHVSHLVLMNTAPASHADWLLMRDEIRGRRSEQDLERMAAVAASPAYARGELAAEADYYRIHFRIALPPELLDRVVGRLRAHFTPASVLLARAIEDRLDEQTWLRTDYDVHPRLRGLTVPTLVVHGDQDLVPVEAARSIADAIPGARLHVLAGCGHFAYLERPDDVHELVVDLMSRR